MAEEGTSGSLGDPLATAFEALKGTDPLVQSAKHQIWRRLWARDNVISWINMSAEMPTLSDSLYRALPQDDVELLETIKTVAAKFGNSPSAFLITQLANDRIEHCLSMGGDSVRQDTAQTSNRRSISVPSAILYPWVFDYTPLGVIKVDTNGNCEYANKKFNAIAGSLGFAGHNLRELFPDESNRAVIDEQLRRRFEDRRPDDYDVVLTRLDNQRSVPVRVAATPVLDSLGRAVGAIAIFRALTFENAVKRITHAIAHCQSSKELLKVVANEVRKLISFDQLHVSAYSADKKYVRSFFDDPQFDPEFKVRWFKMSPAMARFAARQDVGKVDDMEEYYGRPGFVSLHEEDLKKQGWTERPRSLLRCPVARRGRVVASLSIGRRKPNSFSEAQYELFRSLPLREAVTMALYLEDKQSLKFRLDLMRRIFKDWENQEKVASVIVTKLLEQNDWDHAAFFHVDEKRQEIRLLSQKAKNDNPEFLLPAGYKQGVDSGVLGLVYRKQRSVNVGDIARDVEFKGIAINLFKAQMLSEVCLPVVIDDRVCWMLNLEDSRVNAFSSDEVAGLEVILDELKSLLQGVLARHFVETTIDSASDAIIAVDGAGTINKVNPAGEILLGYEHGTLNGMTVLKVLDSPGLLDQVTDGLRLSCEQVTLRREDGTTLAVLLSASPLPKALGGAVFLARDLSLTKRLQELEYLGRVHRELAIQTKTPLTLAFSWLERLRASDEGTVTNIIQELRMVELTFDRLALYEQHEGILPTNKMLLDISEVTRSVLNSLPEFEIKKIAFKAEAKLPWLRGDHFQLAFCIRAILVYLLRFVPEKEYIVFGVKGENDVVVIRIKGILPDLSEAALPGERAESLRRVLVDIALGENILRSFIHANGGVYHQPIRDGNWIHFRMDLPGHVEDML